VTVWSDVDERVLLWVAEDRPAGWPSSQLTLNIRPDEASEELPGLMASQVDRALQRLADYGLIGVATPRHETIGYAVYSGLRVTALGHRLLGGWPDLDEISTVDALRLALEAIAEAAPAKERPRLRRAIGVVGEIGPAFVQRTAAAIAGDMGTGL
jgi:hypothetical protein